MTTIPNRAPRAADREVLTGLVERVTYQNAENGFCVLRVKARGHRELVTLGWPCRRDFGWRVDCSLPVPRFK
jgi:hypothetical protein